MPRAKNYRRSKMSTASALKDSPGPVITIIELSTVNSVRMGTRTLQVEKMVSNEDVRGDRWEEVTTTILVQSTKLRL